MIGKTRSRENMENEIKVREKVLTLKSVNISEIIRYELEGDPPFFTEKIIPGRVVDPIRDEELILRDLTEELWRMYEGYGIVFKGIGEVTDPSGAEDTILKAMEMIEWSDRWMGKRDFIKRCVEILKSEALMPLSIGHGDLSTENMIMSRDGKIYVSDWELARQMPIVFDLTGIMSKVPRTRELFKERIDDLAVNNREKNILSFQDQHFLSVITVILQWEHSLRYTERIERGKDTFLRKLNNSFGLANEIL
ncbi:MAG: phosphotransferase [Deltaproteobacteria bacterium]|uniref:Phosphotransferase n=1 Tax=Candidatus Zymogenus saltonus TaxID=2844893 RepID=A0A9D8KH52_9DELT|nr:phosphotransferase [Candidatus Zymogenus saltonus]